MSDLKTDLKGESALSLQEFEEAKACLAKLPILGPVIWLYGRDAARRHTFVGDLDWLLLPPVVLDQCKLFFKGGIPFGFVSWARVSGAVHERLRAGVGMLAPHEWRSGAHAWLIEVLAPFGGPDDLVDDVRGTVFAGTRVFRLAPSAVPKTLVQELPPLGAAADAMKH